MKSRAAEARARFWSAETETICELCQTLIEIGDLVRWNATCTRVVCAKHGPQ